MLSTFTIIINEARSESWPDIVWRDALASGARVLLDSCIPLSRPLRKLRKIHFANPANRKMWLPLKCMWNGTNALQLSDLAPQSKYTVNSVLCA